MDDINDVLGAVRAEEQRRAGGHWLPVSSNQHDAILAFADALGFDVGMLSTLADHVASMRSEVDALRERVAALEAG